MMRQESSEDSALDNARTFLRAEQQQRYALTELPGLSGQLVTNAALKSLEYQTRFVPTEAPHLVRRGAFRYDRELEGERIARAQALIHRVAPGPFEDPNYFAMLAYQAASIEMAHLHMPIQSTKRDLFSKFLLGTVHAPDVDAFAERVTIDGYTVVVLYSGLIDFIYQAAKAVVEVMNPARSVGSRSAVQAVFNLDVVRARLDSDPRPAERLYRTLEAYYFSGYPRASAFETVPEEHHPLLSLLVGMAERWVIGHEYGHGLSPSFEQAPICVNADRAEEYFSDCNATIATVLSASELDAVPPEFPLSGAIFSLVCLDLLEKARNILYIGKETGSDAEPVIHPKPRDRAVEVIKYFRTFFDVDYQPNGLFDLAFILRTEEPKDHNFSIEDSKRAYAYANVLQTIWEPVKKRLFEDFRQKRPLFRR